MYSPLPLEQLDNSAHSTALLIDENVQALAQLATLLQRSPEKAYQRLMGSQQTQSLGRHVRHILEHYGTLLDACTPGDHRMAFDYEQRQREAVLENDPIQALQRVKILQTGLQALSSTPYNTPLTLSYPIEEGHASQANTLILPTNLGRELAFLTSHSIHHMALLGLLCEQLEITLPSDFGIHPSTLRFWKNQRTAS
ncbi:hypothetical protein [Vreelandella zhaodongensis]|uniref:hypothetical protein n=1 Tax=Vreelandella zhaodongensis TaxID=1176240 RepID=UPI003EB7B341